MKAIGVIPARYGSTRLPAKPLIKINGKPLLEWVVAGVKNCKSLSEIIVATDHAEIASLFFNMNDRSMQAKHLTVNTKTKTPSIKNILPIQ